MSDSSLQLAQQLQQVLTGLAASLGPCAPKLSLQRLSDCFCSPSLLLFRCMAASAHRYSQSVLVSVRISRQGPKVVHYWQRQQHTVPEFAMRFRMIAQWRAATGAWSGVGRVETASLSLKHLLQSSPNRQIDCSTKTGRT
jgi:hypothetical protein